MISSINFTAKYHKILCKEFPDFLEKYISLPILQRLNGIGLLCGTDWTPLYSNRFLYSRFDHSLGTALITWNFTHSKKQTLASLFHDVATPAFSHVSDFRKGDTLKQEATEENTSEIMTFDSELPNLIAMEGINMCEIRDYHIYPICDNEIPQLSSDRLEYMFPSGMALVDRIDSKSTWTLEDVQKTYENIQVLKNETETDELGFSDKEIAEDYCIKFNDVGMVLQKNENKLALNLLGKILNLAEEKNIATTKDFYQLSESRLIEKFSDYEKSNPEEEFSVLFRTFRNMKEIIRSEEALPDCYCINLGVKKRHINPLVKTRNGTKRISEISAKAKESIDFIMNYTDSKFGCVKLIR